MVNATDEFKASHNVWKQRGYQVVITAESLVGVLFSFNIDFFNSDGRESGGTSILDYCLSQQRFKIELIKQDGLGQVSRIYNELFSILQQSQQ